MKFYDCSTAPSPQRVRIFIAEKGIDVPTVQVDLGQGEHLQPAYRKINPRGLTPALEMDDGGFIHESMAICRYLESKYPTTNLMGQTPEEIAVVEMWTREIETDGLMSIAESFRNRARGLAGHAIPGVIEEVPQIPELVERGRGSATRFYKRLNEHLEGRDFIARDSFSIADIAAAVMLGFSRVIKLTIPEDHTHLQRWYDAISQRPSVSA